MSITDRYASAVRSSNLASKPDTVQSDSDVLGAAGLAAKKRPLAIALLRLFSGDNRAAKEIVQILAVMADAKSWQMDQVNIPMVEASDMARKVLAWHRDGVCRVCGGHGFELAHGAPSLSEHSCKACRGTRRVDFDGQFSMERLYLARWLREKVEAEQAGAGAAAMAALAPKLDL